AGWVAAEVGRQPWIVYGLLRTSEALSRSVKAQQVLGSLILFTLIYLLLGAVGVFVLHTKITHGPDDGTHDGAHGDRPHDPEEESPASLLQAASKRADPGSPYSMTDAHQERP